MIYATYTAATATITTTYDIYKSGTVVKSISAGALNTSQSRASKIYIENKSGLWDFSVRNIAAPSTALSNIQTTFENPPLTSTDFANIDQIVIKVSSSVIPSGSEIRVYAR